MEDRHLHLGIIHAIWFMVAFIVLINLTKFIFARFYVLGFTELVHNA